MQYIITWNSIQWVSFHAFETDRQTQIVLQVTLLDPKVISAHQMKLYQLFSLQSTWIEWQSQPVSHSESLAQPVRARSNRTPWWEWLVSVSDWWCESDWVNELGRTLYFLDWVSWLWVWGSECVITVSVTAATISKWLWLCGSRSYSLVWIDPPLLVSFLH